MIANLKNFTVSINFERGIIEDLVIDGKSRLILSFFVKEILPKRNNYNRLSVICRISSLYNDKLFFLDERVHS